MLKIMFSATLIMPQAIEVLLFVVITITIAIIFLRRIKSLNEQVNILYGQKEKVQELFENSEELNKQLIQKNLNDRDDGDAAISKLSFDIHHCINGIMTATTLLKDTQLNNDQVKLTGTISGCSKQLLSSVKSTFMKEQQIKTMPETEMIIEQQEISPEFAKKYPLKILLADDDLLNQQLSARLIKKLGYNVDVVSDGKEALEAVSEKNYNILLLDVHMPRMDGFETTKMIRLCLERQPVIIALTASAMAGDKEKCIEAGMDDYMCKPIIIEELARLLVKWNVEKKVAVIN